MEWHALDTAIAVIGLGLSFFGIGFTVWARRLKEIIEWAQKIEMSLREMSRDLHGHQISTEARLSWIEAKIKNGSNDK